MDAIQRIEFRFRGVKKSHAAGVAGIIDQIIKFIGVQLRQRALKSANKCVKGVDFASAERQRDRPGAQCFNPCNHLVRLGKTRFVGQYYIYAALCQRFDGRASQAAAAACHRGDFALLFMFSPFLSAENMSDYKPLNADDKTALGDRIVLPAGTMSWINWIL